MTEKQSGLPGKTGFAVPLAPCRCLLEEYDEQAYRRTLKDHIQRTPAHLRTEPAEYTHRLETCKACDYLEMGTCQACGCYVELRAASKRGRCPYRKW